MTFDHKKYLTNKSFCPLPWTGMFVDVDGTVKNCIVAGDIIGDLKEKSIGEILDGEKNKQIKQDMLRDAKPKSCSACHLLEKNKNSFDIISSRIYYLRELKSIPLETYDNVDNFNLHHVDIRWSNTCNHACVYCGPYASSKWAQELKEVVKKPTEQSIDEVKQLVFANASQLKNIYMAGGEPLLMKENEEFLELLLDVNPNVQLRVNTNLSRCNTKVFDLICKFKNVHWTVSVDEIEEQFEYVRYGGNWSEFLENLIIIQKLDHKITFNMLWHLLNAFSLFETITFFKKLGFHDNAFCVGPITGPVHFDVRNLELEINNLTEILQLQRVNSGYLLADGYKNLLRHLQSPFNADIKSSMKVINELDKRRNLDSRKIFPEIYQCLQD